MYSKASKTDDFPLPLAPVSSTSFGGARHDERSISRSVKRLKFLTRNFSMFMGIPSILT